MKDKVAELMKDAMRNKDKLKLSTYRSILTAITNNEKAKTQSKDLDVLMSLAKQRKQSIEQFELGGNTEAALQEKQELDIIEGLLPKQMSDNDISEAVNELISQTDGTISMRDMGRLIGQFNAKYEGQDSSKVATILKNVINNQE